MKQARVTFVSATSPEDLRRALSQVSGVPCVRNVVLEDSVVIPTNAQTERYHRVSLQITEIVVGKLSRKSTEELIFRALIEAYAEGRLGQ